MIREIHNIDQLKVGMYLLSDTGRAHEILEVYQEGIKEQWGKPTVALIEYGLNCPQKISFATVQTFKLISKEQDPEYFL